MSTRDRTLVAVLAPLATFALYWVLLMNPALDRRAALEAPLAEAQVAHDEALARASEVAAAQKNYEQDYAELVELSKAIPQTVAVSDLMRELGAASEGTGIEFSKITMGAGDAPADEGEDATTAETDAEGLEEIPVDLTFKGRFFGLADLFASLQRFVTVADGRLEVRGRLIRVDSFSFASTTFPNITASVSATIYAAPAAEGPTDGASPAGPRGAERGDGGLKPVPNFSPATVVTP